jgi:hypothetical protein
MAITNAQQYKQLVNPPMQGNKRPGYRGDDAARADKAARSEGRASMGRADPGNAPQGDGPETGAPNQGLISELRRQNLEKAPDVFQRPERFQGIKSLASRLNPLSFILGLINPGLGIASRFFTQQAPDAFQTFKDSPTLADFIKNMRKEDVSPVSVESGRDSGLRQPIVPIERISESDMSIPMIERISESDMSLATPEQKKLIALQNRFNFDDGGMIGGGIMDAAGRQNYFLGKLVKKATRAVKKIVKSPVGKLGLGAALAFTPFGGKTLASRFMDLSNPMKALIGGGLLSAAPLLFQQEEEQGEGLGTTGSVGGQIPDAAYTDPRSVLFRAFRMAEGGRIGLKDGEGIMKMASNDANERLLEQLYEQFLEEGFSPEVAAKKAREEFNKRDFAGAKGGDVEPVAKKTMPLLDMGGQEMDLRAEGGFVPIGRMEKADDVPARLSKNEFVFTADAVRNAGDGDVDKGAEVMYNMMKNLEAGGDVSEESQGLKGAREMFQTSKRLEEVI